MAVNTTPKSSADAPNPKQAQIKAWKDKLRAGNLSQNEINNLVKKITNAGGQADPKNFAPAGSTTKPGAAPAKPGAAPAKPGGGRGGMAEATAKITSGANNQDAGQIVQGEKGVVNTQATQSINKQNPSDFITPTGSQTVEMVDGRPVVTQSLSPEQQRILQDKQTQTNMGAGLARTALNEYQQFQGPDQVGAFSSDAPKVGNFNAPVWDQQFGAGVGAGAASNELIKNYDQFSQTGGDAERAKIEDAVYSRLTKNVDRDYGKEFDNMEQRMYNRGIPLDPSNPAYKQEMDALNEKYAAVKENASQQAVQMGGEELERTFGMERESHQQTVSDIGSLYGVAQNAYSTREGGQAQTFGQQLAGSQQRGAQQAQQFGQDVAGYNANLAGNAQNFGQDFAGHQQNMTDINQLQGMGTGLLMPNLPGFTAPTMQQTPAAQVGVGISGQNVSEANTAATVAGGITQANIAANASMANAQLTADTAAASNDQSW